MSASGLERAKSKLAERIRNEKKDTTTLTAIDMGCGTGAFSIHASKYLTDVVFKFEHQSLGVKQIMNIYTFRISLTFQQRTQC